MKKKCLIVGAVLLAGVVGAQHSCGSCEAHDHEADAFHVTVHNDWRVFADHTVSADDAGQRDVSSAHAHAHSDVSFCFPGNFSVETTLKLEQKHSHDHGGVHAHHSRDKTQIFDNHVLMLEQLKLVWSPGPYELFAGKFNPKVGLDQHAIPGWYGYEIEEELGILGRMGAGVAYNWETGGLGTHRLEASSFFRDTTFLNKTLINESDEPDSKEDGGIANTEDFSSWAVSLSGESAPIGCGDTVHRLGYVAAFARQAVGYGAEADHHTDEKRWVAGGTYTIEISPEISVRGVAEMKRLENFHTHRGEDLVVTTVGGGVYVDGWSLGGSYSILDHSEEVEGHHAQISLGYTWSNGIGLQFGWKGVKEDDERRDLVGVALAYHGVSEFF